MTRRNRMVLPALMLLLGSLAEASPPGPEEVMKLPDELHERLQREVAAVAQSPERRVDLLVDFISGEGGLGFRYRALPTLDVAGTIEQAQGNCLSFTLLFLSMARALGLEAYPREVRVPSAWQRNADLIFDVGHVNVGVATPASRKTVDFEPDFLLSQRLAAPYRGQRISDQRALAHFYNNRAAELLAENDPAAAREWVAQALALDPEFGPARNTAGVVERRLGYRDRARQHFRHALETSDDISSPLFNLIALERAVGRWAEAEVHARQLEALRLNDPWFQWAIGRFYDDLGEPARAAQFYARAADLAKQEYLFQVSLARTLLRIGDAEGAGIAMARASELLPDKSDPTLKDGLKAPILR